MIAANALPVSAAMTVAMPSAADSLLPSTEIFNISTSAWAIS